MVILRRHARKSCDKFVKMCFSANMSLAAQSGIDRLVNFISLQCYFLRKATYVETTVYQILDVVPHTFRVFTDYPVFMISCSLLPLPDVQSTASHILMNTPICLPCSLWRSEFKKHYLSLKVWHRSATYSELWHAHGGCVE